MERKQRTADRGELAVGKVNQRKCATHCHKEGATLLPHCIVCGEIPEGGIMGGIFLQGQFLCDDCERQIVALDGDRLPQEEYQAVADKLKGLWKMA